MPGDMKQCPTLPESDALSEATKDLKSEVRKTDTLPKWNGKIKVLKSEMRETVSFSGKLACNDVNLACNDVEKKSFLKKPKWTKVNF